MNNGLDIVLGKIVIGLYCFGLLYAVIRLALADIDPLTEKEKQDAKEKKPRRRVL